VIVNTAQLVNWVVFGKLNKILIVIMLNKKYMKKIILSASIMALVLSCGSEEEKIEKEVSKAKTEVKSEVKKIEEDVNIYANELDLELPVKNEYSSYDFLTIYNQSGHKFLEALAGKDVKITNFLCVNATDSRITAIGYNGEFSTEKSEPENNITNNVNGKILDAHETEYLYVDLWQFTNETNKELKDVEKPVGSTEKIYHSSFSINIPGDELKYFNSLALDLYKAKITEIKNF